MTQQFVMGGVPLISVGMPTYNGMGRIEASLASILGQSFCDFEVIISDDWSTDGTFEYCQSIARYDGRVRVVRNAGAAGAVDNFNTALRLARGELFLWHAQDDLREPSYFALCVEAFSGNASLVYFHTRYNDVIFGGDEGQIRSIQDIIATKSTSQRFFCAYKSFIGSTAFYGVYRRREMGDSLLWRNFIGSDCCIFNSALLTGDVTEAQEILLTYSSRAKVRSVADHMRFLRRDNPPIYYPPYLRYLYENIKIALLSGVVWVEKLRIIWLIIRYEAKNLPVKLCYRIINRTLGERCSSRLASRLGREDLIGMRVGYTDD